MMVDQFSAHFETSTNWLPSSSSYQGLRELKPSVVVWHDARFAAVLAAKGRQEILDLNAFRERQAVLAKKVRHPRPPRIQETLKRVHEFRARLAAEPGLTREALAREVGINPTQLTRLLRLFDLAPEIQRHILALPPSIHRSVVTERRLRPIARIKDREEQLATFHRLLEPTTRLP